MTADRASPGASVVIPAHNVAATLGDQLTALVGQLDAPRFEVIVVANRCTDATIDVARSFADTLHLRVIEANDRASAAHARNIGAANARGPVVLFCDADDRVAPTWVARMTRPLATGAADFVGGVVEIDRTDLPPWLYRWRFEGSARRCIVSAPGELPYVISASLGITAAAFQAVGGFDESFGGAAGEDTDICWRLLRHGYRLGQPVDAPLRYTQRTTLRSALAQRRAYSQSHLQLLAREGILGPAPSWADIVTTTARGIAHRVVKQRELDPRYLVADGSYRWHGMADHRRATDLIASSARQTPQFDLAIDPAIPLVGGLAFAAERHRAGYVDAARTPGRATLETLSARLRDGDVFVDVGADIGIITIAGAKAVGPTGRVVAVQPGGPTTELFDRNLRRHRAATIVDTHTDLDEQLVADLDRHRVAVIRIRPGDRTTPQVASLIQGHPEATVVTDDTTPA